MNENLHHMHWTEDELLDRLYGLDAPAGKDVSHLNNCVECAGRWRRLEAARERSLNTVATVDENRLRRQREAVWRRVDAAKRPWLWRAVPATATVMMLMVGVALHQTPAPEVPRQTIAAAQPAEFAQSDDQFFQEIASVANAEEPSSAAAIRNLFDVNQEGEAQ